MQFPYITRHNKWNRTRKKAKGHDLPWEAQYSYAQALKLDDTVWLAGQVGHDAHGALVGTGDMTTQMRQAYANITQLLAHFGLSMADVGDETLYVLDNDAAFAARQQLGWEV